MVPPAGFEPAPPPPEGGALSPELRGPDTDRPEKLITWPARDERVFEAYTPRPGTPSMAVRRRRTYSPVVAGEDPAEGVRVLVVDDDDVIRQLICVNLELEGFEVHMAVDGLDALEKVREVDPAVVTLDIMMPRLDGWDAAARLRSDPETAHVKVVLLSARAQEADLKRGSRLGVDHYLTKPFDPDELISVVRRLAGLPERPEARVGDEAKPAGAVAGCPPVTSTGMTPADLADAVLAAVRAAVEAGDLAVAVPSMRRWNAAQP